MAENVSVRVLVEADLLEDFKKDKEITVSRTESVNPEEPLADGRFVEWIAVAIAGSLAVVLSRLIRLGEQQVERGVLLDLSTDPHTVNYVSNIPYGTLVVKHPNGQAEVHKLGKGGSLGLGELLGLIGKVPG